MDERHLFIIARDQPSLWEYLRREFSSEENVEVIFSRPPEKADDVLVRLARQLGAGAAVVTSDRAVRDAAGRAGCAVVSADQFLDALSAEAELEDPAPTSPPPKSGNPRRLSKDARAAQRALRRLRRA